MCWAKTSSGPTCTPSPSTAHLPWVPGSARPQGRSPHVVHVCPSVILAVADARFTLHKPRLAGLLPAGLYVRAQERSPSPFPGSDFFSHQTLLALTGALPSPSCVLLTGPPHPIPAANCSSVGYPFPSAAQSHTHSMFTNLISSSSHRAAAGVAEETLVRYPRAGLDDSSSILPKLPGMGGKTYGSSRHTTPERLCCLLH